jgi:hypothetical protein
MHSWICLKKKHCENTGKEGQRKVALEGIEKPSHPSI